MREKMRLANNPAASRVRPGAQNGGGRNSVLTEMKNCLVQVFTGKDECPFWRFPFDAHRLAAPTRLAIASATAEARRAGFLLSGDLTKVRDARLQHTGSNPIHQSAAPTIIPQMPSWCLAGCPLGPSC